MECDKYNRNRSATNRANRKLFSEHPLVKCTRIIMLSVTFVFRAVDRELVGMKMR
jgi:hypothetical protein